jgi:hypothetical protein
VNRQQGRRTNTMIKRLTKTYETIGMKLFLNLEGVDMPQVKFTAKNIRFIIINLLVLGLVLYKAEIMICNLIVSLGK